MSKKSCKRRERDILGTGKSIWDTKGPGIKTARGSNVARLALARAGWLNAPEINVGIFS